MDYIEQVKSEFGITAAPKDNKYRELYQALILLDDGEEFVQKNIDLMTVELIAQLEAKCEESLFAPVFRYGTVDLIVEYLASHQLDPETTLGLLEEVYDETPDEQNESFLIKLSYIPSRVPNIKKYLDPSDRLHNIISTFYKQDL